MLDKPLKIEIREHKTDFPFHRFSAQIVFDKPINGQMGLGNCGSTLQEAVSDLIKRLDV